MNINIMFKYYTFFIFLVLVSAKASWACTGISLKANDGSNIVARTVEWSLSNAHHDTLVVYPRKHEYTSRTPDDGNGLEWTGEHGFVALSSYGQPFGPDGMNEHGLYVGMFYFPGFASLAPFNKKNSAKSMSVGDFMNWILSSFSTVEEVRQNIDEVIVVDVMDKNFGGAALPFHWKIADPSGKSIIIEITDQGHVEIFDAFLGVITNSPGYKWHLTNMRNYLGLQPEAFGTVEIDKFSFSPLGSGTGLHGLPGDYTPSSRFVGAAALTATARPLKNSTIL
ncbi:MAG: linear amide C-N hydrolase, partial [Alphaproteobacteria bacterium]|nr:linear amide C-N hydrolase [Alphaproteobacteria bacterium]